ncbi:InlB B-repeat-containing protein, partial [Candidatus Saccharibacteria bacterium]|nr:InlB B-repeat-containing protein [Candidatus Saccharibacteria bacterium]
SAYAAFSASISRSGTVNLAEAGSNTIKPTSTGTLGTGSDTVSITTNCTYGGYNLYVSATSTGGTNLNLSGASASELTNAKNYIATSSTATGSETTLSRDTWGVGKTASAFSGLPPYAADASTLTPFYTGTTSASYDFYYGVNVSTAKTPGTYTGEVLYTVLMDSACTSYTLNFNGNSATTNTLTSRDIAFDDTIDLSTISSSSVIARTGYTLTGWKDQNNNSYGITGAVDVNPGDLSSVTLTALWTANTYTIAYAAGSTGGTCSVTSTSATYDQNVTLSSTKCTKSGYEQKGWSTSSSASNTKTYNLGQTLTKPNLTATNGGTVTLYPYFESTVAYMQGWTGCSSLTTGSSNYVTLTDSRDGNQYKVRRLADGKCWMVDNLLIVGSRTLTSSDSNVSTNFTLPASSTTNLYYSSTSAGNYYVAKGTTYSGSTTMPVDITFYNYYAATAGGSTSDDICPKGWRLPIGGTDTSTNDFSILAKAYGGSGSSETNATVMTKLLDHDGPALTNNIGYYNSGYNKVGQQTGYQSSTASDSSRNYFLALNSNNAIYLPDNSYKGHGRAVRCLLK